MNRHKMPWAWVTDRIKALLPKGRFARSVTVLAGGTALGQGIVILASPILTRLYTPEDFGVLAVYSSFLGILSVIASLRYELAIPLPEKDEDAASLLMLSLGIVVAMSLLIGVGVWLFGKQIARWANAPALQRYLWLLPLGVVMVGTYQVFNYWAVRKQAFGRIARTKLHQGLGATLTQIGLGSLRLGPLGLIVGQVVGQGAGVTTLAALAWKQDKQLVGIKSLAGIAQLASRYRRFPQLSSLSGLLNNAGLQLPGLLLAALYGPRVAGWFALGQKIVGVPMSLLGQAVAQVYVGTASRLIWENEMGLRLIFLGTAGRLLLLGAIPMTVLVVTGPWLFSLLFGTEWGEAGFYVQLLAGAFLLQFVVTPLSQTLNILERQDLQLAWDLGRLALVVGLIWGAWRSGGTAWKAIAGYSLATCLAYVALFCLNLWCLNLRSRKCGPRGLK